MSFPEKGAPRDRTPEVRGERGNPPTPTIFYLILAALNLKDKAPVWLRGVTP